MDKGLATLNATMINIKAFSLIPNLHILLEVFLDLIYLSICLRMLVPLYSYSSSDTMCVNYLRIINFLFMTKI